MIPLGNPLGYTPWGTTRGSLLGNPVGVSHWEPLGGHFFGETPWDPLGGNLADPFMETLCRTHLWGHLVGDPLVGCRGGTA
jgi:hypothetical protein